MHAFPVMKIGFAIQKICQNLMVTTYFICIKHSQPNNKNNLKALIYEYNLYVKQ